MGEYNRLKSQILVASSDAKAIDSLFKRSSYKVTTTDNGQGALAFLRQNTPSLMIMDAKLAEIDGSSISYRVKRLSRLRDIPVILLVDNYDPKQRASAELSGADQLVYKPFTGRALREAVRDWLDPELINHIDSQEPSYNQAY